MIGSLYIDWLFNQVYFVNTEHKFCTCLSTPSFRGEGVHRKETGRNYYFTISMCQQNNTKV